jgi:hypothetical protein
MEQMPQINDYPRRINPQFQPPADRDSYMQEMEQMPQINDYPRRINPQFQPPADRPPYMREMDQLFGNISPQPQKERYAY